ncbi:Regulatory protein MarR [uncultured Mycobacterium sp.]|uniref:Regulatory protein MarR n=1 Tax=uncultured Mycobacterium sp. TaxID=171292 RepID=A0A1Y5PJK1_9MYCO|nr:Regulatory protein MarR [uncultured Mycobacterium sp.]
MESDQETPDEWLSAEQLREWVSLMALVTMLPARLDAQLNRDAGLSLFEYHVMVVLSGAPERTRVMSELALQTRGSLSRLSHAVSRLESAGWVQRHSCGGAGRRTEAQLTDAGEAKLKQCAPGHVREARRLVVEVLTDDELARLGHAARRIVAAIDPAVAATLGEAGESAVGSPEAQLCSGPTCTRVDRGGPAREPDGQRGCS